MAFDEGLQGGQRDLLVVVAALALHPLDLLGHPGDLALGLQHVGELAGLAAQDVAQLRARLAASCM